MRDPIPVLIPYLASAAQGRELELAVAGWRKHFYQPHVIVIIGDNDENVSRCLEKDMRSQDYSQTIFIPCPRIDPVEGQYTPHLDILHKFYEAKRYNPRWEWFIYASDDKYAVRNFTLSDIRVPKISEQDMNAGDWEKDHGWLHDLGKTREYCISKGWPTRNWVCHLPIAFSFNILSRVMYECRGQSYVWENLYFNYLTTILDPGNIYEKAELVPPVGSKWKYEVRTDNPGIRTAAEARAIWINNARCGWSEKLESILLKHYGLQVSI